VSGGEETAIAITGRTIRIAVRTPAENRRLVVVLRRLLKAER